MSLSFVVCRCLCVVHSVLIDWALKTEHNRPTCFFSHRRTRDFCSRRWMNTAIGVHTNTAMHKLCKYCPWTLVSAQNRHRELDWSCLCVPCVTVITCCSMSIYTEQWRWRSLSSFSQLPLSLPVFSSFHLLNVCLYAIDGYTEHTSIDTLHDCSAISQTHTVELLKLKLLIEQITAIQMKTIHRQTRLGKWSGSSSPHQQQHCLYVPITCCSLYFLYCQLISSIRDVVSTAVVCANDTAHSLHDSFGSSCWILPCRRDSSQRHCRPDTAQCQSEMKSSSSLPSICIVSVHSHSDFFRPSLCLSPFWLYSCVRLCSPVNAVNSPVVRPRAAQMHGERTVRFVGVWFCFRAPVIALPQEEKGIFTEKESGRGNPVTPVCEKQ